MRPFVILNACFKQVVFSEVWWIGKKEDNPEESQLPMPQSVIEAGRKAHGALDGQTCMHAVFRLHDVLLKLVTLMMPTSSSRC